MSSGRDESYSLFHSVGKVLYGKGDQTVEEVVDRSSISSSTLVNFLQSNALQHLSNDEEMEAVASACQWISEADVINNTNNSLRMGDVISTARHHAITSTALLSRADVVLSFPCLVPLSRWCVATQTLNGITDDVAALIACRSDTSHSPLPSLAGQSAASLSPSPSFD